MIPYLSLVIPVYNAAEFIEDSLQRISAWKKSTEISLEVIVVNDGSTDETAKKVEQFLATHEGQVQFISYPGNRGKGHAVKTGMLAAKGKYRIFTDADIPFGFAVFETIVHNLEVKEFDVCIGNRMSPDSVYNSERGWVRRLSSTLFTFLISRFVVTGVSDTQCGLKGFKGNVADILFNNIHTDSFAFDVELLYLCYKYEFDFKRIPVKFEGNTISTINLGKSSVKMFLDVMKLPLRYHFTKKYLTPAEARSRYRDASH